MESSVDSFPHPIIEILRIGVRKLPWTGFDSGQR